MKPIRLKISGLNSFTEEQVINFELLTEKGLFGIFGPTGSGKSTIIDAITLSMYGKIPRNSKDFINTDSLSTSVVYEFEIGVGTERRRYIVERNIKKDLKNGGYKTTLARLREITAEGEKVLAEKEREVHQKIVEIIGLTAEDFTRSVVLPQGKFSEFLKLSGRERRDMLERIFGLERYGNDLMEKVRKVKNEKTLLLGMVNGELSRYEGVTEEALKEALAKLELLKEEEKNLSAEREELLKEREKLKEIWERQKELNQFLEKKRLLDEKASEIEVKRGKIEKARKALSVKPYIDSVEETEKKLLLNKKELEKHAKELEEVSAELQKIEKDYEITFREKEEKIPLLIEKEERLKRAVQIEDEIKRLSEEREKLLTEYKNLESNIKRLEEEKEKLFLSIENLKKNIAEKEEKVIRLRISTEEKENVFKAFELEKEFERVKREREEKAHKIEEIEKLVEKQKGEYERIKVELTEKEEELQKEESIFNLLEVQKPLSSEELFNFQKELESKRLKLIEAQRNKELEEKLEKTLKEVLEEREKLVGELEKTEREYVEKGKALDALQKEIEEIVRKNMAGELAEGLKEGVPCPVCGSVHHINLAKKVDEKLIEEKKKLERDLRTEREILQEKLIMLKSQLSGFTAKEEISKAELEKAKENLRGIDLEILRKEIEEMEVKFKEEKEKLEDWAKEKEEKEKVLKRLKEEKGQLALEEARIKERLQKDLKLLEEYKLSFEGIEREYQSLLKELENWKEKLGYANFSEKVEEINQKEKLIEKLREEVESLKKNLEELNIKREKVLEDLNQLIVRKTQVVEVGKEKRSVLEKMQKELDSYSEGKDVKKYLEEVQKERAEILQRESFLKNRLEEERRKKQEIESKKVSTLENQILLTNMLKEQIEKLELSLSKEGFKTKEEALSFVISSEEMSEIEIEVKRFENEYTSLVANIERLEGFLKGRQIEEEHWNRLEERIRELEEILTGKRKEIGATEKAIHDMKENLKKVEELTKKKKELEHVIDMLEELDKLFQGNKFVDFIASKQLKYITFSASKRLKEISRGRYALEIDSENNFVMRDDFNGGVRRSVDTLSGGETFLTSLSLALALSSHIQLKGKAPLEFFFLDEGFGSLDSELLDVVMTSLERLKKDKMVVGIISHVEELKDRVPVKLIVTPPTVSGEGSKVRIEYT